ncbi:MAG: NfeD family protein [Bacteroidales bacterium]
MSWSLIIVLILIGLIFLLLEMLVIPGITVAGVIGFACVVVAVWAAFATHGTMAGLITLGLTVFLSALALFYALKSKTWRKLSLETRNEAKVNVVDEKALKPGDSGIAISRMAPAGTVEINGEQYEAHTYGEFLNPGTRVIVDKIEFNKIYVKTIKN